MFNKVSKSFQYGQHTVVLETGEIARQASGAVLVSIDDTVVLATVVGAKTAKAGQDFFPLTVDRSEEHTSELQSLMRISYAVFCLKKKKKSTKRYRQQT